MLDKHDSESIKEAEELVSLDASIEEAEKDLVVKLVLFSQGKWVEA